MPAGDRKLASPARGLAEIRRDLAAVKERLTALLEELDHEDGQGEHRPAAGQRSYGDEMVDPGWAAQYIKVSKDRLKDLAKEHAFGWLVGGRIKIHKGRFFEYILTHRPPQRRR